MYQSGFKDDTLLSWKASLLPMGSLNLPEFQAQNCGNVMTVSLLMAVAQSLEENAYKGFAAFRRHAPKCRTTSYGDKTVTKVQTDALEVRLFQRSKEVVVGQQ